MEHSNRLRFIVLLFLQLFAVGTVHIPIFTLLLRPGADGGLAFSPSQLTAVAGAIALAPFVSLVLVRTLERLTCSRHHVMAVLLLACSLLAAALALAVGHYRSHPAAADSAGTASLGAVAAVGGLLFFLAVCNSAVSAIGLALVLYHLKGRDFLFFPLRAAGTLGFIAAGLTVAFLLRPVSPQPLWLAAAAYLVLALHARVGLPETPAPFLPDSSDQGARGVRCLATVLRQGGPGFFLLALCCGLVGRFFDVYANPFLCDLRGLPYPSAVQTLAQALEVFLLILTPSLLRSRSHRHFLILGPAGWSVLYLCFVLAASRGAPLAVFVGLPFQGFNCLFGTAASLFLNARVSPALRESGQSVLMTAQGVGTLTGTVLAGWVASWSGDGAGRSWQSVWLVSCLLAVGATALAASLYGTGLPRFARRKAVLAIER